jgi:hypothetical protein
MKADVEVGRRKKILNCGIGLPKANFFHGV